MTSEQVVVGGIERPCSNSRNGRSRRRDDYGAREGEMDGGVNGTPLEELKEIPSDL